MNTTSRMTYRSLRWSSGGQFELFINEEMTVLTVFLFGCGLLQLHTGNVLHAMGAEVGALISSYASYINSHNHSTLTNQLSYFS